MKNTIFPSHLINPKNKDKKWISDFILAAWKDYKESYPDGFYNAKDRYHETRMYMLGKQSITKYKKMLDPQKTANNDESWFNIDWSIVPIIPKFRRIALGTLRKSEYNIKAQAIDPLSKDEEYKFYQDKAAKILLKKEFEKQGLPTEMLGLEDVDPGNLEELEMHMKYSYKHRMASEVEQAIDLILSLNKFKQTRKEILEDIHDYGVGGYKEYFDSDGSIKLRRVNPANLVTSYTTKEDFTDCHYIGEIQEMTISDLKQLAGDQFGEEEYKKIAETYNSPKYGQQNQGKIVTNNYAKNYDGQRIEVLDLEFFSVNDMIFEERTNNKGNTVVGRTNKIKKNTKNKKYTRTSYKVVYRGKWIIGSNYFFDCELATNMKRAKSNMSETTLSYHLSAPDIYQMSTYSLGQQMKGIADQIQLAWYKLQNVMLRARPRGIMIEIGALENVPLGRGGKAMKPIDIIDMYSQTGNLVYRAVDEDGNPSATRPIAELNNGIGNEAVQYFDMIQRQIGLLRDIIGFNEITDGSTPDPRTLKGVATLAAESTNNSLSYIKDSEKNLLERLAYNLSLRIQDAAKNGNLNGYAKALGNSSIEFFSVDPDVNLHEYGIILDEKPDQYEKEKLNRRIEQALQSGQINIADSLVVENTQNVKQAEELLAYKIEKNIEREEKKSLLNQQQNAQIQQQAAIQSEQAKQQTVQLQAETKLALMQKEKELEMQMQERKYQFELQLEQLRTTGRIEQRKVEGQSRETVAKIKKPKGDDVLPLDTDILE